MGNWHPSQKKQEVDLSPQILSQTSIDDKVWLEVTEENLFNESFTNEKFYLLQSRNAEHPDHSYGKHIEHTPPASSGRDDQAHKRAEDMVGIVHDNFPIEQYATNTLDKLVAELQSSNLGKHTLYYDTILQKRISILKRIHLALSREKAREKLFVSSAEYAKQSSKNSVPTVIRMTVRLFISMLQQQKDTQLSELTLQTLHSMLKELPLLSLQGEPQDCLDSFHDWLLSVVTDSTGRFSPVVRSCIIEALVIFSLTTGSLTTVLSAIRVLISCFGKPEQQSLQIVPYLRQLAHWQVNLVLSPIARERLSGSWIILWEEYRESRRPSNSVLPPLSSPNATITTNGSYIYLHDACGLVKVGTGFLAESPDYKTTQGKVYYRDGNWKTEEKGWIACVQDKLYYRSPSIEPASLAVFDAATLNEIGSVFQDGRGSISTVDNSAFPFGPEKVPDFHFTNRSPLFSDGRYLYVMSQHKSKYGSIKYYVDSYDPLAKMAHQRRVKLRYAESARNTTSIVLHPRVLEKASFYTNGHYMIVVIPPPLATDYGYDAKTYVSNATLHALVHFILLQIAMRFVKDQYGTFVGNSSLDNHPVGPATCYDSVNNVIWNYSNSGAEIERYANEGLAPKFKPLSSLDVPLPSTEDEKMSASEVVVTLLTILGRLSVESMPSPNEKKLIEVLALREPFCIDINTQSLSLLCSIIRHCKEQIKPIFDVENVQWLEMSLHLLQILKVNLYRLAAVNNQYPNMVASHLEKAKESLNSLKDIVLDFVFKDPSKMKDLSLENFTSFEAIQREACEVFTVGVDLFFPSTVDQAQFMLKLLNSPEAEKGKSVLLDTLMNLFSDHPNASYLVLPEQKKQSTFDPMSVFLPMISKLIQEAEGSVHPPIGMSYTDYAPNYISSYPPMRLLMAIQKDLLIRAAQSSSASDAVVQALAAYAKKIFSNATSLFQSLLQDRKFDPQLTTIRFSVIGALLPTLTNSLFLFSQSINRLF